MSSEMLWHLLAENGGDPAALARSVVEAFGEMPAEEIAVVFDVALRAGALDKASAAQLVANIGKIESITAAADLVGLEVTAERLRAEAAEASKRHGADNVAAASETKDRVDARRRDLAAMDAEIESLKSRLEAVRRLAAEVRT